jgi:hypothetical protein
MKKKQIIKILINFLLLSIPNNEINFYMNVKKSENKGVKIM